MFVLSSTCYAKVQSERSILCLFQLVMARIPNSSCGTPLNGSTCENGLYVVTTLWRDGAGRIPKSWVRDLIALFSFCREDSPSAGPHIWHSEQTVNSPTFPMLHHSNKQEFFLSFLFKPIPDLQWTRNPAANLPHQILHRQRDIWEIGDKERVWSSLQTLTTCRAMVHTSNPHLSVE